MNSSLIGKIEKAKRYADERDRIRFTDLCVTFHGEHNDHAVACDDGNWRCSCNFFAGWGTCSHTMALQRILGEMAPKPSTAGEPVGAASE